jgi:hypothetical protein
LAQGGFGRGRLLIERGYAPLGQETFGRIDLRNAVGDLYCFSLITAGYAWGEKVKFEEIAKRLGIAWIEHDGDINLFAEATRKKQLLEYVRMLSHYTQNLGVLAVILGGVAIESDGLLRQSLWCVVVAECVADLGKEVVR